MKENETNKNRGLITLDDKQFYGIATRAIEALAGALRMKLFADDNLKIACEGVYSELCDGNTDDHDYCSKSMMDLIMIIIRKHGGAISSQALDQLLGKCDGYPRLLTSLISLGMLKRITQDDGKVIGFYIPID